MSTLTIEESPIDALLREQQQLQTPVARFSVAEQPASPSSCSMPRQAKYYRDLIPLSRPGEDEQYAFEVDLDKCTGCKACVSACHNLNGLEENETWRDVGTIHGGESSSPYLQTVTTACHHCEDPACLNGCPVLAYEKDPVTGVVHHLDDQCIGCQYCVLKCPYDVPKYSSNLGIVRKCDMCHNRLAEGEAPACVQACPTEAIRITTVPKTSGQKEAPRDPIIPGAWESSYTRPTTRYVSEKKIPADARPGDAHSLRPQHAHGPLIGLLVLTQLSVGALAAALWAPTETARWVALVLSGLTCVAGLASSVLHLGRPLKAWRVFLGLRKSWLSREAVVFGFYAKLLAASGVALLWGGWPWFWPLASLALLTGLVGVFTSVMIYVDTRRQYWNFRDTMLRFYATTAGGLLVAVLAGGFFWALPLLGILVVGKALAEKRFTEAHRQNPESPHYRTARIVAETDAPLYRHRVRTPALLLAAGLLLWPVAPWLAAVAAAAALVGGEVLERYWFFRAVDAPKMPGGVQP
ncbi:MAG: 4Fe-4S binding protein [Opitutales bacterium]|nr:4Fe-4S binding protein [Opitutales bacterium]